MDEKSTDKEKAILNSMKGYERVKPSTLIFSNIKGEIYGEEETKVVPIFRLLAVAAAILILISVNVVAVYKISDNVSDEISSNEEYPIISSFQIYN